MYPLLEDHSNGFYTMNDQTLTLHSSTKFGTLEFHSQDRPPLILSGNDVIPLKLPRDSMYLAR